MREFLYVSDKKLARFIEEDAKSFSLAFSGEGEVSLFDLLKVKFGLSSQRADQGARVSRQTLLKLDRVLEHIDDSDFPALWFEDDAVEVGSWVQFECEMKVERDPRAFVLWPVEAARHGVLLVLHGSGHHATDYVEQLEAEAEYIETRADPVHSLSDSFNFAAHLYGLVREGERQRLRLRVRDRDSPERSEDRGLDELVRRALMRDDDLRERGLMAGFARVTAVYPDWAWGDKRYRLVTASPLFVERM